MGEGEYSPGEGRYCLSPGAERCHPSPGLSPFLSPRGACRGSHKAWDVRGILCSCLHGHGGKVKWGLVFKCFELSLPPLRVQALNKDARLLAGTALSMLVNTAPQPEHGASAVLALFQLPNQGTCSVPSWEWPLVKGMTGTGMFGWKGTEAGATHQQSKLDSAAMSCCWGAGAPAATGHLP